VNGLNDVQKKINAINYKHETNALDYTFKDGSWQIDLNVLVHLLRYYVQCSFFHNIDYTMVTLLSIESHHITLYSTIHKQNSISDRKLHKIQVTITYTD